MKIVKIVNCEWRGGVLPYVCQCTTYLSQVSVERQPTSANVVFPDVGYIRTVKPGLVLSRVKS